MWYNQINWAFIRWAMGFPGNKIFGYFSIPTVCSSEVNLELSNLRQTFSHSSKWELVNLLTPVMESISEKCCHWHFTCVCKSFHNSRSSSNFFFFNFSPPLLWALPTHRVIVKAPIPFQSPWSWYEETPWGLLCKLWESCLGWVWGYFWRNRMDLQSGTEARLSPLVVGACGTEYL